MKPTLILIALAAILTAAPNVSAQAYNATILPMDALVQAHELLDEAPRNPRNLLRALEMLNHANGQVLTLNGQAADLGYDDLYGEVYAALYPSQEEAGLEQDQTLQERFSGLPAPLRGNLRGWAKANIAALPEQGRDMDFLGGEPAIIYVRASRILPLSLSVVDEKGSELCRANSKKGRALCRWEPVQTMRVTLRVQSKAFNAEDTIAIYTN